MADTTSTAAILARFPSLRDDATSLILRLQQHQAAGTTDSAPAVRRQSRESYRNPAMWRREIESVHCRVPLPLALSCQLPRPGSYVALTALGRPLLLVRTETDGIVALINSCRHRGARLVEPGAGHTRRFVCPFPSWTYGLSGDLQRIEDAATFGCAEPGSIALPRLPAAERFGLVFVALTPGQPMDLDSWLPEPLATHLAALDLASCHHHGVRHLAGPNWKIVLDGYLESYHVGTAHRASVSATHLSNLAALDAWGPHMRLSYGLRALADLPAQEVIAAKPEQLTTFASPVYWLFPGLNISGGWGDSVAVSLVLPGDAADRSHTQQHLLLRQAATDDAARALADATLERLYAINSSEDYPLLYGIQEGLHSDGDDVLIGRNEPGVQRFHEVIDELVSRG